MSRGERRRRTNDGPLTRAQEVQRAFRERRRKQKEDLEGKSGTLVLSTVLILLCSQ